MLCDSCGIAKFKTFAQPGAWWRVDTGQLARHSLFERMTVDRHSVPVDKAYVTAIGLATFCFANLEWNAINCGEKLNPGYIGKVAWKTEGTIGKDVANFAALIDDPGKQARYRLAATEFKRLVERRNDLMHAKPAATVRNESLLYRDSTFWEPDDIDKLADEFAACAQEFNELYHHVL
jgi:hypothetical protein